MFRFLVFAAFSAVCFAQSPADLFNRPPADVDRALRARIAEFYQDHVDGKFRQAEALVAEDTKDYFYSGNKTRFLSFEINRIDYSDGFTRAKAIILCEQTLPFPEFAGKPVKVPTPSTWKLIDGQWYWYIDQTALNRTPFGIMKPGPGGAPTSAPAIPNPQDVLKSLAGQVMADKTSLQLRPGASDRVSISNGAPGPLSIALIGSVPGVDVKLDRVDIRPGEKATLTFRAGENAKPGTVTIRVEQSNQIIPIQIEIQ